MKITIESKATGKVKDLIPDKILAKSYPCFSWAAIDRDMNLSLVLATDPLLYDEDDIREFLLAILPYVENMQLDIRMTFKSGDHLVAHNCQWEFIIRDGKLFRYDRSGSCIAGGCISK